MMRSDDLYPLSSNLPVPVDDGACDHLAGLLWPSVPLRSMPWAWVSLAAIRAEWLVVYFYPRTGLSDQDPPGGLSAWDSIPPHGVVICRHAHIAITGPSRPTRCTRCRRQQTRYRISTRGR